MFVKFLKQNARNLITLELLYCSDLKDKFYGDLPEICPSLQKISINSLKHVDGRFIPKIKSLKTLILPW
jgi:hypothetical protein